VRGIKLSDYCFSKRTFMYKLGLEHRNFFLLRRFQGTQMNKEVSHLSLVAVIRVEMGEGMRHDITCTLRLCFVFSYFLRYDDCDLE
jgi:hypothetical protein